MGAVHAANLGRLTFRVFFARARLMGLNIGRYQEWRPDLVCGATHCSLLMESGEGGAGEKASFVVEDRAR